MSCKSRHFLTLEDANWDMPHLPDEMREVTEVFKGEISREDSEKIKDIVLKYKHEHH